MEFTDRLRFGLPRARPEAQEVPGDALSEQLHHCSSRSLPSCHSFCIITERSLSGEDGAQAQRWRCCRLGTFYCSSRSCSVDSEVDSGPLYFMGAYHCGIRRLLGCIDRGNVGIKIQAHCAGTYNRSGLSITTRSSRMSIS